eukprot:TRINITY_DN8607_c0_g1_i2.p1 TRINITY_DN8607_c0_g1~~TRINITY_DN8607_c0_g1_i2.p1  ORF type:complete len:138 (-),score=35.50 TRINITY_DN8607_c0_g1_i2:194-607(-)
MLTESSAAAAAPAVFYTSFSTMAYLRTFCMLVASLLSIQQTAAFVLTGSRSLTHTGTGARTFLLRADPVNDSEDRLQDGAASLVDKVVHGVEDAVHSLEEATEEGFDKFDKAISREGRMNEQAKDIHNIIKEEKKEY